MPEIIKAYRCKYRCGRSPSTSKKSVERHEKTCFSNPERKACKTCKYLKFEWDGPYTGHRMGEATYGQPTKQYYCEINALPEGKTYFFNCEKWELK